MTKACTICSLSNAHSSSSQLKNSKTQRRRRLKAFCIAVIFSFCYIYFTSSSFNHHLASLGLISMACKLVSLWEKKTATSEVAELFLRESLAGKLHDIAQCLEEDRYIEMTVKILGCGCVLQCCTTQPPPDESFGQMLYPTNKKQRGGG